MRSHIHRFQNHFGIRMCRYQQGDHPRRTLYRCLRCGKGMMRIHQRRQHNCRLQMNLHQMRALSHTNRHMLLPLESIRRHHLCNRLRTSSDSHLSERCCSLCCLRMPHHFGKARRRTEVRWHRSLRCVSSHRRATRRFRFIGYSSAECTHCRLDAPHGKVDSGWPGLFRPTGHTKP